MCVVTHDIGFICVHYTLLSRQFTLHQPLCVHFLTLCLDDIEQQQPLLLWTLYFNMELCHVDQDNCHEHAPQLPTNMYLTSDPDGTMTYENAMQEVSLFCCALSM